MLVVGRGTGPVYSACHIGRRQVYGARGGVEDGSRRPGLSLLLLLLSLLLCVCVCVFVYVSVWVCVCCCCCWWCGCVCCGPTSRGPVRLRREIYTYLSLQRSDLSYFPATADRVQFCLCQPGPIPGIVAVAHPHGAQDILTSLTLHRPTPYGPLNQDCWTTCKTVRMPGVEPGSQAWEACMIPLHCMRLGTL